MEKNWSKEKYNVLHLSAIYHSQQTCRRYVKPK